MDEQVGGTSSEGAATSCGKLLRRFRSHAGLTQEELGDRSGYTANYIGKLERDQRELSSAALERLVTILALGDDERAALQAARDRGHGDARARPLAGRARELAELRRHLAGLGPPVLLLAGEPGIGKTCLLEEAASRADGTGWSVARGGCQRRAQDPYAPLTNALIDALKRLPDADRARALAQGRGVGLLSPELAALGEQSDLEVRPERERQLLFSAVARFLHAVAGEAGVLLVLDDLQWAGPDALDLLAALLSSTGSPIRLVGAYRDSEAAAGGGLAELVADLARGSQVRVLALEPLSDAEAEQLALQLAADAEEMQTVLPALVRRAGGVPFFLVSFVEDLRSAEPGAAHLTLPWTVKQVIGQRLLALPESVRELLAVAAAGGRVVSHSLLVRVAGRSDDEVVEALETATTARLLAEDPGGEYLFSHDLIRETIEDGLSAGRRRLLHRRIAETLERDGRTAAESLAFHFALSDHPDKAIGYLELAGDQAQQRLAYAAAAEFFQQVLDRQLGLDRPQNTRAIGEKLGVCLYRVGRYDAAITVLEQALEEYRTAGDEDAVQRLTGRLADAHFRRGTANDALEHLVGLVERGELQAVGPRSDGAIVRLEGLARLLFARGSYKRMPTVGRTLARAGRATGNPRLQRIGKRVEGLGLINLGRVREAVALLETTIPPDPIADDDHGAAEVATLLSAAYLSMGALEPGRALSERMLQAAELAGDPVVAATHTLLLAAVLYVRGDWEQGRRLLARSQEPLNALGPSALSVRGTPLLAQLLAWEGKLQQARSCLETSLRAARSMRFAHVAHTLATHLARLDLLQGRPEAALTRMQPLNTKDLPWNDAVTLLTTLAATHLDLGDPARAQPHAERAVAEARRIEGWVEGILALEVLGTVAARRGNHDLADTAYQEGLERARAIPFPYGEAHLLRASGLLDRERSDEASAQAKLSKAQAILERLQLGHPSRTI